MIISYNDATWISVGMKKRIECMNRNNRMNAQTEHKNKNKNIAYIYWVSTECWDIFYICAFGRAKSMKSEKSCVCALLHKEKN